MAIRGGIAPRRRTRAPNFLLGDIGKMGKTSPSQAVPAFVQPKLRVLEPGSPDYIRRERLLKLMRDDSKPQSERTQAAIEALPLCYVQPDPIDNVTHTFSKPKTSRKR